MNFENQSYSLGSFHLNESLLHTGGAEGYVVSLVLELEQRGVPVFLGSGRNEPLSFPHNSYLIPGVHKDTDDEHMNLNAERIESIMHDNNLDILHLHNINNGPLIEAIRARYKTVKTVHDYRSICPVEFKVDSRSDACTQPVGDSCLRCIGGESQASIVGQYADNVEQLKSLDLLLTTSQYVGDQLRTNGIPHEKIRVIPLFIPTNELDSCEIDQSDDKYKSDLLFVGRIEWQKGLREALRSFSLLPADSIFTVCGDGGDLAYCKELASELGILNRVRFAGWVDTQEKVNYIANTKIVVVPSIWPEPFGLVGLESMHFKKPVVGFDVGGISEWLHDGDNGILVPRGDSEMLSDALNHLLLNPETASEMGERGREIADSMFSAEKHIDGMLEVYAEL